MKTITKSALAAIALSIVGAGAALAADACACCKDGEKMECCDKMKSQTPNAAEPEHQH